MHFSSRSYLRIYYLLILVKFKKKDTMGPKRTGSLREKGHKQNIQSSGQDGRRSLKISKTKTN